MLILADCNAMVEALVVPEVLPVEIPLELVLMRAE